MDADQVQVGQQRACGERKAIGGQGKVIFIAGNGTAGSETNARRIDGATSRQGQFASKLNRRSGGENPGKSDIGENGFAACSRIEREQVAIGVGG